MLRSPIATNYLTGVANTNKRHERQVDEVRGLDQTDRDEERSEQSALSLGLPGDAGDQRVTGDTVTDAGADSAAGHDQPTADESARSDRGISIPILLDNW